MTNRSSNVNDETNTAVMTRRDDEPTPMQMIAEASRNPEIDPAKMHALMDLHERVENRRAAHEYAVAMAACQFEMPLVVKDAENKDNHSRFAKLETIQSAIKPVYLKHGFAVSMSEDKSDREGWIRVRCVVRHKGGHSETFYRDGPVDNKGLKGSPNKTEIQGAQASVSYLYRNMLCGIFGVTVAGQDRDGANGGIDGEFITETQKQELHKLAEQTGTKYEAILKYAKVDQLADIRQGANHKKVYYMLMDKLKDMKPAPASGGEL
jgi:hypothetical protein